MKTIYVVLMKSTTSLSRIVGLVTSDKYTHVSLGFDESLIPLYTATRKNGVTIFPAGPCREYLNRGFLGRHPNTPCAVYALEVNDEVFHAAKTKAEYFADNMDDYGFNVLGLIFCQLGIPFQRNGKYFCSQFVSEVLQSTGALELSCDPTVMKPSFYLDMPQLKLLYEGTIGELLDGTATEFAEAEPVLA